LREGMRVGLGEGAVALDRWHTDQLLAHDWEQEWTPAAQACRCSCSCLSRRLLHRSTRSRPRSSQRAPDEPTIHGQLAGVKRHRERAYEG
jgi:hypothetical protein